MHENRCRSEESGSHIAELRLEKEDRIRFGIDRRVGDPRAEM